MNSNSTGSPLDLKVLSLGEVMLRLDPREGRVRSARSFDVWEGGGEYNVTRGLASVFGIPTGVVTSFADNEVGRLIAGMIKAGGVSTDFVHWKEFDGVGRVVRNGLNFTERGFGVRGAKGVSDRGHTAVSLLSPDEVDFDEVFARSGAQWLHTGGIYAALSDTSAQTALAAMKSARKRGVTVSYDLNYRPSLWKAIGGISRAREVNRELASYVDVMIGNEEDFTAGLGFEVEGVGEDLIELPEEGFRSMILRVVEEFSNISVIATTLRAVHSASVNDWSAVAWSKDAGLVKSEARRLEILDRVGGGDSFASGLIFGLLSGFDLQYCVELGAAHGALAMTTPGDASMALKEEVVKLASGGNARVDR